ncbi:hypothetical protein LDENG_00111410 [Lucifuga dentata]|nr:hypothetical protein LDENG_00111410 [Lucifuga dentata]
MTSLNQKDTEPPKTKAEDPQVPPLLLPHYDGPGSASYHNLGYCLRTNIFPGAPLAWKSLLQDSYTSPPVPTLLFDPHHWYGHKTDEMIQWMERNFVRQKLNKMLMEMEKKSATK